MAEGCRPNQRMECGQARATRCFHGPAGLAGLVYCPLYGPAGLAGLVYCPLYGPAGLAGLVYCPLYGLAGQRDGLLSGGQEHWPWRRGTLAPSSADPSGNLHRWKAQGRNDHSALSMPALPGTHCCPVTGTKPSASDEGLSYACVTVRLSGSSLKQQLHTKPIPTKG